MKSNILLFLGGAMLCTAAHVHAQNISSVAGTGAGGFSGDGAAATAAQLNTPGGIALDAAGNLYIADGNNNRIRKVSAAGIITTIAGKGTSGFSGDGGAATAAELKRPTHVAVDASGNVYITDADNARIRKVNTSGVISTYAGNGSLGFAGDGGPATDGKLYQPAALSLDATGNLYIADGFNQRIRKVTPAGVLSTVAGKGTYGFSGDGGSAIVAEFNGTQGVAIDGAGNIFVGDKNNNRIRKVNTAGTISTYAGKDTAGYSGDSGAATLAKLKNPTSVRVGKSGELFFVDFGNNLIRKVDASGIISTIAGTGAVGTTGDGGPATAATFTWPTDIALDTAGNLYIADQGNHRIRKIQFAPTTSTPSIAAHTSPLNIFPNPSQNVINIALPAEIRSGSLVIRDMAGNVVTNETLHAPKGVYNYPVSALAPGSYVIVIYTSDKTYYGKVDKR